MTPSNPMRPGPGITLGAERAEAPSAEHPVGSRHVSPLSIALAVATPAVTVSMQVLSRYWADHGAKHSIGDMVPLAVGGVMCMAAVKWTASDDAVLTGTLVTVAGSCLLIGTMAYPAGAAQSVIAAAFATVGGWVLSWRVARENRKTERVFANQQADRDNAYAIETLRAQTALGVATISGQADVAVAQINGATALGVADRNVIAATGGGGFTSAQLDDAWQARRALDATPAAAVEPPQTTGSATPVADPRDAFFGQPTSLTSASS